MGNWKVLSPGLALRDSQLHRESRLALEVTVYMLDFLLNVSSLRAGFLFVF